MTGGDGNSEAHGRPVGAGDVEALSALPPDAMRAVEAAGWHVAAGAPVLLADARATLAPVRAAADRALTGRCALVAVIDADARAGDAYDAGATHVAVGSAGIADALAFAARHARRLRGEGRLRRFGEVRHDGIADGSGALAVTLTGIELVNHAIGRAAGDAVLAEAERRLAAALAPYNAVLERAGTGFVALFDRPDLVAPQVEAALAEPYRVAGEPMHVGARVAAASPIAGEPTAATVRRALSTMAQALGRGRASPVGGAAAERLDRLAADLARALERDEIEMVFQPQVVIATGRIGGVEALARWHHPLLGELGAEELLSAAERGDLAGALSDHLQTCALAQVAAWPDALAGLRVAINVTAADIARADFAGRFLARVADSGVARARVTAEITEDRLIANLDGAAALLAQLRGAGCRVAIDDFGTGYSSLAYLKALPLDYLKIDRRLTQDITGDERARVVVRGVLAMARSLGLETIAEGVETAGQRDALAAERCTYYQGFLCAGALDTAALVRLVEGECR